jgi:hypothetical protein
MQDHVHRKLVNHKQFVTFKVINYVCKLVNWTCNFDANKNCTHVFGVFILQSKVVTFLLFAKLPF